MVRKKGRDLESIATRNGVLKLCVAEAIRGRDQLALPRPGLSGE
jgi:hypothetical protein